MNHIDELFHDIDEKEIVEIESSMDKEKQQRIEAMIMKGIQEDNYNEDVKNDVKYDVKNEVMDDEKNDYMDDVKNDYMNDEKNDYMDDVKNDYMNDEKNDYMDDVKNDYMNDEKNDYMDDVKNDYMNDVKNDYMNDVKNDVIDNEKNDAMDDEKNEAINDEKNEVINLKNKKNKKRFSKKKIVALILAATFLMGMTVYAAEKNEWDIAIVNYMGISNADTVQLPDGVVEIGASALSNGVTMKAVTSVGDKNSAYIRIDTNYKLPSTFNEKTDYIITKGWDTTITKTVTGLDMNHGGSMMYFNNKGNLSFMMYISNCEGINRKNVKVTFTDLYIYHDLHPQTDQETKQETNQETDHGTLLLSGKWTLSWKYHYRSNVNTYYPMKLVVSNGETCLVTKLEISPLTICAEAVKNPTQGRTEASRLLIKKITMKDGSVIEFDQKSTSGGCRNNTFLEGYRDVMEMGKAIDPSKVYSITIGDEEIIL